MAKKSFEPLMWSDFFDVRDDIHLQSGTFRIYRKGYEGVLLLFLHGGGFSGLSWAILTKLITEEVNCQCIAVDIRGHGDTQCSDENDFSLETLTNDIHEVIFSLFPAEAPQIILVGHSMGGAIAINLASSRKIPSLSGLIVIDVVEGSAIEALKSMRGFLESRPKTFSCLTSAIEWSVRSHQISNPNSARVSFPGHLKRIQTLETATSELDKKNALIYSDDNAELDAPAVKPRLPPLDETVQSNSSALSKPPIALIPSHNTNVNKSNSNAAYTWRIDLQETSSFWNEWFQGMSEKFLKVREPKLLLTAGVDRLDKTLTVAQMQGKFQFQVMPKSGHAVHEDQPDKVAAVIAQYLTRYHFATSKGKFEKSV